MIGENVVIGAGRSSVVDHPLILQWVVRSIPHGGPIQLCLVPVSDPQLMYQKAVVCVVLSMLSFAANLKE